MAIAAFCSVCQRTVYVDTEATPICPVCSSPLLETTRIDIGQAEPAEEQDDEAVGEDQPGAK
jgi:predicted amidophosphoribosyltransferase